MKIKTHERDTGQNHPKQSSLRKTRMELEARLTDLLLASLLGGFEQRSFREGGDPVQPVRLQLLDPHPAQRQPKKTG